MNRYSLLVAVASFLLLASTASAGDTSCLNITLPNVLNLGSCLKHSGDVCTADSQGAIPLLGKVVVCALKGVATLDLKVQVPVVLEVVQVLLRKLELGLLADQLLTVCNKTRNIFDLGIQKENQCSRLDPTNKLACEDLIVLNLPSTLNLGKCAGKTLQTCSKGEQVSETILEGVFDLLACLLDNLSDADLLSLVNGVLCDVVNLVKKLLLGTGNPLSGLLDLGSNLITTKCNS